MSNKIYQQWATAFQSLVLKVYIRNFDKYDKISFDSAELTNPICIYVQAKVKETTPLLFLELFH